MVFSSNQVSEFLRSQSLTLSFLLFFILLFSYTFWLSQPTLSLVNPSGFYDQPVVVDFKARSEGRIYYTLDGSYPRPDSAKQFEYPFELAQSTSLRAQLFDDDNQPIGEEVKASFLIEESFHLPVFALSIDPDSLWDEEKGIFVHGPDEQPNFFKSGREWHRPIHVHFYEEAGRPSYQTEAMLAIFGGATRNTPQKSLRLCSRDGVQLDLNYKFFPDRDYDQFGCLVLRISGNDWGVSMMRDGLMHTLVEGAGIDTLAYRPSSVYINGQFWGMYNLRERIDLSYLQTRYGQPRSNFTILFPDGQQEHQVHRGEWGDQFAYREIEEYLVERPEITDDDLTRVEQWIDLDNLIAYAAAQLYFGNHDWPDHNIRYWRFRTDEYDARAPYGLDGRWRYLLYDTDAGFGLNMGGFSGRASDPPERYNMIRKMDEQWVVFRELTRNQQFVDRFLSQLADFLNSRFQPDYVIEVIDRLAAHIEPEIPRQAERWPQPEEWDGEIFQSLEDWLDKVGELRHFARSRPGYVHAQVLQHFGLDNMHQLELSLVDGGRVRINSLVINQSDWMGKYFEQTPVEVEAIPEFGYRFTGWRGDVESSERELVLHLEEDLVLEPVFEKTWWRSLFNF